MKTSKVKCDDDSEKVEHKIVAICHTVEWRSLVLDGLPYFSQATSMTGRDCAAAEVLSYVD